ncbi:MAG: hypothetical protein C5B59_00540 [Bacteroidetes bacterium]|nr:MAG: hypothetical protein C5B59_00540 [Bacteroidota bacterium]
MMNVVAALKSERSRLQEQLDAIDKALKVVTSLNGASRKGTRKARRSMSAAGRRRIVAAQKARWAKWKKEHKA